MKKKHAARKIHARTPWTKFPGVYVAPDPWSLWDAPHGHTIRLGTPGARQPSQSAQARVAAMSGLALSDPPRVPVGTALVAVAIDGTRVRLPADWEFAIASKNGRDVLVAREPNRTTHLLLIDASGALRELTGVPDDVMRKIVTWKFG